VTAPALWYIDRASGIAALVLLTAAVVLGVTTSVRVHSPRWPRFALADVHRNVSLLALVFGALHVATSVIDTYVSISLVDAFVPFVSAYKPFWLGIGTLSADLMLAVLMTTALRRRLGYRAWHSVHLLAYGCWATGAVHAIAIGTDSHSAVWGIALVAACIGAAGSAFAQRRAFARTQ
jgi:predicted ferric reductase